MTLSFALPCRPLWRTSSSSKSLRRVDSQLEAGSGAAAAGWGQERCAVCMPRPGYAQSAAGSQTAVVSAAVL